MALSEKTVINQVTLLLEIPAINIQWATNVYRDEDLISTTYMRKAYTEDMAAEVLVDVPNAQAYLDILGWSIPNEQN